MNKREQFAVFEKVPAHGSEVGGIILGPFNSEEEATEAGNRYGYNTDNYYVDKLKVMETKKLTKEEFLEKLKTDRDFNNRYGRKHITEGKMVLPPCHYGFQVYTRELSLGERKNIWNKYNFSQDMSWHNMEEDDITDLLNEDNIPTRAISLMWNQRSCDFPLGIPFNIASYGLLLMMIADEVNMVPEELIGNLGDCHIYLNQIEGCKEQIKREPRKLPTVHVRDGIYCSSHSDVVLSDYEAHPAIKFPLSN